MGFWCIIYIVARKCSKAEAEAIEAAKNLVPSTHNGKPTRGAKWIYNPSGTYTPKKADKTVFFTMKDGFIEWVKKHIVDWETIGDESEHTAEIIIKSSEPGAMGIGRDLLEKFKSYIDKIEIK